MYCDECNTAMDIIPSRIVKISIPTLKEKTKLLELENQKIWQMNETIKNQNIENEYNTMLKKIKFLKKDNETEIFLELKKLDLFYNNLPKDKKHLINNHEIYLSNKINDVLNNKYNNIINSNQKLDLLIKEINNYKLNFPLYSNLFDEKVKEIEKIINFSDFIENNKDILLTSNETLYNISNILIQEYNDEYPKELVNQISNKISNVVLKFILIDTQITTFTSLKKYNYTLLENRLDDKYSKTNSYLDSLNTEIEKRYDTLLEYNKKNIMEFNNYTINNPNLHIKPFRYYIVVINDLINITLNTNLLNFQNLLLKGKKVGIIFIMFTKVEKKYLKLKIANNYIENYSQTEMTKKINNLINNFNEIIDDVYEFDMNFDDIKYTFEETNYEYDDPLYDEIVEFVMTTGNASAALFQRRFKLGYNRAARIVDLLEERGIIGPQNGSKPREVLVNLNPKEEKK